jgi:hypothetical protein
MVNSIDDLANSKPVASHKTNGLNLFKGRFIPKMRLKDKQFCLKHHMT